MDGMRKPRCEDCRAFKNNECRRRPPALAHQAGEIVWLYPSVDPDDFCTKWRNVLGEQFFLWDVPEDSRHPVSDP